MKEVSPADYLTALRHPNQRADFCRFVKTSDSETVVLDPGDDTWQWCDTVPYPFTVRWAHNRAETSRTEPRLPGISQVLHLIQMLQEDRAFMFNRAHQTDGGGFKREVADGDIVLGRDQIGFYVGTCSTPFCDKDAHSAAKRELTFVGQMYVIWASIHRRLRDLYHVVRSVDRVRMPKLARFLVEAKPVIGWDDSDDAVLADVVGELTANAVLWAPARSRFWSDDGTQIVWENQPYAFSDSAAEMVGILIQAAMSGDAGIENYRLKGRICPETSTFRPSTYFRRKGLKGYLPGTQKLIEFRDGNTRLRPQVAAAIRAALA